MQEPMPTRPRSAGRPRLSGTTRTRRYFNSREGKSSAKDEGEDVSTLILHSKDKVVPPKLQNSDNCKKYDDTAPFIYSLLGNFDDDNDVFQWDTTRIVKPQDAFVDDMQFQFSLSGIKSLYKKLTWKNEIRTPSDLICHPDKSFLMQGDEQSSDLKGPSGLLFVLFHHITTLLMTSFGNLTRCTMRRCMKNDNREETCQSEEGLIANPANMPSVTKSRNLLRVEERIRRELPLEKILPSLPKGHNDQSVAMCSSNNNAAINDETTVSLEKKPITAKMDESFWLNPGQDLVGPEKRGGNVQREVVLTVDIGQIILRQHPEFSAQEKALARVSCMYDQYRTHIDANTFHYSVTRMTENCRRLQSIDSKRSIKGNASSESSLMINSLFNNLKSSAASLVKGSESIKSMVMQMKLGWNEFLATKENDSNSRHADAQLKTSTLFSCAKLNDDLKELSDEIKSTKPALSRIQDELPRSSVISFQFLPEVETALSDLTHIFEVIELDLVSGTEEVKLGRRRMEKYFARLLVNGYVVGDTKVEQLDWTSFSVKLSHRFNCKMSQRPTCTCVQIWKSSIGFLPDKLVCSIGFLPDKLVCGQEDQQGSPRLADRATYAWLQFSSNGSEMKGAIRLEARFIERTVKCSDPGIHMSKMPVHPTKLIRPPIGDFETHTRKTSTVKPPSHRCADRQSMMEFKHSSGNLFTNKILLEEPLRHALIKKRQRDPTLVPSPIPITELEVQNNDVYHDLMRNDGASDEIIMNDAFKERPYVSKQNILDIFRGFGGLSNRRKHHLSEVIQDVALYRFADCQLTIPSLPRKRSLFPKTVHRLPVTRSQTHNCSLLLTVVGGHNIPTKVEGNIAPKNNGQEGSILRNYDNLPHFPTVEGDEKLGGICKIKFRGKTYRTEWKETLSIPLCELLEGSSPISLQEEVIDIFLFDCVTVDLLHMGGFYEDEETKSIEYRYLAHVSVPLAIILRNGTINGFVHCYSPDYIVGYVKGKGESDDLMPLLSVEEQLTGLETGSNTILHIHATSDPLIIIPPLGRPEFQSMETESILSRVEQWSQTNLASFDSVLWPDSRGSSFLPSRFLSEQAPPPGFNTLTSCAQYVSLIPSFNSIERKLLKGRDDHMVLTGQQFLNILAGTRRDHAVLLTNFFLYLSSSNPDFVADVFLAAGFSIPEGNTTWVLRRCRKNREVVLWDAMTGCAYPQDDESCPLQKIYYLVSTDNMYANVQPDKSTPLLDFDVSNSRMWAPLHGGKSKIAVMTVQDRVLLHYTPPNNNFVRQLQSEACESVQNAIRGWRQVPTSFRPDISAKIGGITDRLEQAKLNGNPSFISAMALPESITKARTVFGFALHVPFTGLESLIERVKATEIHRNRSPRVEYAVASRAFAYPGGVVSLWVFVCSIVES